MLTSPILKEPVFEYSTAAGPLPWRSLKPDNFSCSARSECPFRKLGSSIAPAKFLLLRSRLVFLCWLSQTSAGAAPASCVLIRSSSSRPPSRHALCNWESTRSRLFKNSFRRATTRLRVWKRLVVNFFTPSNILVTGENFNLCPAELCQIESVAEFPENPGANTTGLKVESFTPPGTLIDAVEKIVAAAGIDVGGVEYIIDDRDGRAVFYDINALSNFVADAPRVIGFDPHIQLVDFLERQLGDH